MSGQILSNDWQPAAHTESLAAHAENGGCLLPFELVDIDHTKYAANKSLLKAHFDQFGRSLTTLDVLVK
jgi:hypothetical protein